MENFYVKLSDDLEIRKSQSELLQRTVIKNGYKIYGGCEPGWFERQYLEIYEGEVRRQADPCGENYFTFEQAYAELSKPTFKKGDYVTDDNGDNIYLYSHEKNGNHYPLEKVYPEKERASKSQFLYFGRDLRHCTSEEIAEAKEKEARKLLEITINGYKMKYDKASQMISFGCASYNRRRIWDLNSAINNFNNNSKFLIESVKLTVDGRSVDVPVETLNDILAAT